MPALDDPHQLAYDRQDLGEGFVPDTIGIPPVHILLKDNETVATLYPITDMDTVPQGLLEFMCEEFNREIDRGQTYPQLDTLELETYKHYWFGAFAAILLIGNSPVIDPNLKWDETFLGTFYIKPNYPGRCAHVCNAGFLVNAEIRGKGIGKALGELYLNWAPRLGYTYSVFNLVFKTNEASARIWDGLKFDRIGLVKGAAMLKGHLKPVDAIIFGKTLTL